MSDALVSIQSVDVSYGHGRRAAHVLHDITLDIHPGETLGLVGESGSGKTTLGRALLGLVPVSSGRILFGGRDITHASRRERRGLATEIQVVFQDPYSSLNPAMRIRDILIEPLMAQGVRQGEAESRIRDLLHRVALPSESLWRYAREFSGGQRQRIAIARALALEPRLIVCDEPVSALDLSTQLKVLDLLTELQQRTEVAYLFVSHDLSVVRHVSHRVAVMLRGNIVELGSAAQVTEHPRHPYTQRLWAANLIADPARQAARREFRHRLARQDADQVPVSS